MVNKCVVVSCISSYRTGENKSIFHFPEDNDLNEKQMYVVNRKILLLDRFEKKVQ